MYYAITAYYTCGQDTKLVSFVSKGKKETRQGKKQGKNKKVKETKKK